MTLRPAPAHVFAGAIAVGLALANLQREHGPLLIASGIVAAAIAVADPPGARIALLAVVLLLGGWWWGSARLDAVDRSPMLPDVGLAGRATLVVTAPVVEGLFGSRTQGEVRTFRGRPVNEPVQIEFGLGRSPPQGAILDALVQIKLPDGPKNGFDYRTWLRRHGIHVIVQVDDWSQVGARGGFGGLTDRLRAWLVRSIAPGLGGERRAVVEGIVLGEGSELSPGLRQDFQASGLYHILAVSGQNVVLVAAGALMLAWLLGISRWIGELGALLGIGAYVLAVGPQPSVIRAGIAGALASFAWLSGRARDSWQALLVAAIFLLGWNPYNVYDPGFQLSFAAVAAIFTVVPRIAKRLEYTPLPRGLRMGVAVSLGCSIVTAPILWIQFGYLPILGVPANALAEPAMPVLLGLAFLTAAVDLVSPGAASVVAWLNGWAASYIALCARAIGSLPFAEIQSGRGLAILIAFVVLASYAWYRWHQPRLARIPESAAREHV
ncbi:MAG TPA: ComEC/Rec2 family competence protein [Gaiellaceae bacterium]|jgi:competence protein ComEC|nr:ComEC/Rec2 family competence protein [Gaiellaceae bacterium]